MTSISDEKRRNVASALRGDPNDTLIPQSRDGFDGMTYHEAAFRFWDMCRRVRDASDVDIVYSTTSVLADLIDRPTCFDTESKDSKSFTCSACGFSESKLVVSPFTLSFSSVKPSYRYCPKCGARVVRGDADRLKGGVRTSYERDTRIPYRLGTDHYCEFEDGGGFVHMGDTVEVCEDCYDGQFSCTGKLLYVEYGSDGFITLVRISCPSDENDCVCVDCDGVFFKPEKGAASD